MADTLEQEIQAGLGKAFENAPVETLGSEFLNITHPELVSKSETPATAAPETKAEPIDSSLKQDESAKVDSIEAKIEISPSKSFEELLAEQSAGKFKSWKEVDDLINIPKDELDEEIKHLNELKKSGVKFDRDFWEVQTKNYASMTDPFEVLLESMRLKEENKGLSDDVLLFKLKDKYQFDKWSEDGTEPTETEQMQAKILERDAELERDALIARQQKLTTVKKPDQAAIALQKEQNIKMQADLEKQIDEIVPKFSKLSVPITIGTDGKITESADYDVSEADRKEAANTLKQMTKDVSVFWNMFKGEDGNISNEKVYEMLLKLKHSDNRIKIAHQNAMAKGAEAEVKRIKKIDFTPEGKAITPPDDWRTKLQQQVENNL